MNPLLLIGALGVGAYVLLKGGSSASGGSSVASAQQAALQQQAATASASAQAWNAQAQALNLTQDQAQQAYDIGLTPQEYVDSGMAASVSGAFYDPMSGAMY